MFLQKENIVCLDAGFRNLGVAVFSSTLKKFVYVRCFTFKKQSAVVADDCRITLERQAEELGTIMDRFKPIAVLAELPTGASRSSRAIRAMAMSFASVVVFCATRQIQLEPIKPSEIKRAVLKKGAVSKNEVIACVNRRYGPNLLASVRRGEREHVADAICCLAAFQLRKRHV